MAAILLQPIPETHWQGRIALWRQVRRDFQSRYGRQVQRGTQHWLVHSPVAAVDAWPWLQEHFAAESALMAILPVMEQWLLCAWDESGVLLYCQLPGSQVPLLLQPLLNRPDYCPLLVVTADAAARWGHLAHQQGAELRQVPGEQLQLATLPHLLSGLVWPGQNRWRRGVVVAITLLGLLLTRWWWQAGTGGEPVSVPAVPTSPLTELTVPAAVPSTSSQAASEGVLAMFNLLIQLQALTGWETQQIRYDGAVMTVELQATYGLPDWLRDELPESRANLVFHSPRQAQLQVPVSPVRGPVPQTRLSADQQELAEQLDFWLPALTLDHTDRQVRVRLQHPFDELVLLADILRHFQLGLQFAELRLANQEVSGMLELRWLVPDSYTSSRP